MTDHEIALAGARKLLLDLGVKITWTEWRDYHWASSRMSYVGKHEYRVTRFGRIGAYGQSVIIYTDSLADAVTAGLAIAREEDK